MTARPRVAICFFGLVKDYGVVAQSVTEFILAPLLRSGLQYDIYIHTYNQSNITNPRNGEADIAITPTSILRHFPQATFKRDNPIVADRIQPLDYYLRNGDPWSDNPRISMLNYIRQLYSLRAVTALWVPSARKYTYVIYLRPDVRFTTPLALNHRITTQQIAIPNFHNFGGCNDRFAYGRPNAMKAYGERLNWVDTFFTRHTQPLHAERYLLAFLQAHKLQPVLIPFHFIRVRADGKENIGDQKVRDEALQV